MSTPITLVIKIGTSSLTNTGTGHLALSTIASLVETLTALQRTGYRIILVSSGAVGVGCARLGLTEPPKTISMKQAVAAVGQGRLMRVYDDLFTSLGQPIAQVLLSRSDLVQRSRYVNSYRTFRQLLQLGVIPIVNENDTVTVDELKFGDNDTLSALVASLVGADWLFLLTDVDRLYSADPRYHPDAQPISLVDKVEQLTTLQVEVGDRGSAWGDRRHGDPKLKRPASPPMRASAPSLPKDDSPLTSPKFSKANPWAHNSPPRPDPQMRASGGSPIVLFQRANSIWMMGPLTPSGGRESLCWRPG